MFTFVQKKANLRHNYARKLAHLSQLVHLAHFLISKRDITCFFVKILEAPSQYVQKHVHHHKD